MLRQRILTAIPLVAAVLVLVFVAPRQAVEVSITGVMLVAAYEWTGFVGSFSRVTRLALVVGCAVILGGLYWSHQSSGLGDTPLYVSAAFWLASPVLLRLSTRPMPAVLVLGAGLIIIVTSWFALLELHARAGDGPLALLFVLVFVWAADVGAYAAGRAFGRLKLAPVISPGKTWEGVGGGLVLSMSIAAAAIMYLRLPIIPALSLAIIVFIASVVGDLIESLFKRQAGLKDSGHVLPGHGGVLDRIDSLNAGVPLFLLGLRLMEI